MYAPKFAVNHTLPSLSASNPCGPECGGSSYSLNVSVLGSNRPSTLAIWPVYHTEPSGAYIGSCGRDPGVGTTHSLTVTLMGPEMIFASGCGLGGNFAAK